MNNIEFYPTSKLAEQVIPAPKPAKLYIPDWYKEMKPINGDPVFNNNAIVNKTVKSCVPFLDALVSGYIQETWSDINISMIDGKIEINTSHPPDMIKIRQRPHAKISDNFKQLEFAWQMPWLPKVPNGYSCIFTQPFNNFLLPFVTSTGIIDSDGFYKGRPGNYPVYFYNDFWGTIPAGTPMYQIIPIKRESWNSSQMEYNEESSIKATYQLRKTFSGGYKKLFHNKKMYQ